MSSNVHICFLTENYLIFNYWTPEKCLFLLKKLQFISVVISNVLFPCLKITVYIPPPFSSFMYFEYFPQKIQDDF